MLSAWTTWLVTGLKNESARNIGLTVAVGLAVLAPHPIKKARVPDRALRIDAGHDQVVAGGKHPAPALQVDLDARVDGPADVILLPVADNRECVGAAGVADDRAVVAIGADIDVVDHARDLSLAQPCLTCKAPTISGHF